MRFLHWNPNWANPVTKTLLQEGAAPTGPPFSFVGKNLQANVNEILMSRYNSKNKGDRP